MSQHKLDEVSLLAHLKVLSSDDFQGRKISSAGNIAAGDYIIKQLKQLAIKPLTKSYKQSFVKTTAFRNYQGNNIVALIPGNKTPQKYIVLSAHYDHLGKQGRKIFNGADDNASGTAALLSIAKNIENNRLNCSVILLFTDGEEQNLLGAKAFVDDNQSIIANTSANINLDMLAGDKRTNALHFIESKLDRLFKDDALTALSDYQKNSALKVREGFSRAKGNSIISARSNWSQASDHGVFHQNDIAFVYFGVGEHRLYHTEDDNYDNVNLPFFVDVSNYIYGYTRIFANNL